jgi:hypothetical protein
MNAFPTDETTGLLRSMMLCVIVLGLVGLGAELLLLRHDESAGQLIAPVLIGVGLVTIVWHLARGSAASVLVLQITMVLFIAAGFVGMALHYFANVEFQREVDPSIAGLALFRKAMAAKAPPALAPGSMTQLGLLGLAYTFRHPALRHRAAAEHRNG